MRLIAMLAVLAAPLVLTGAARRPHLELLKSTPADVATVQSVSEIRLWFSEAPMNMGSASVIVRVLGPDGKIVANGNPKRDAKDTKVYAFALPKGLEPRAYTVAWETMADDGDPAKGQFKF